MTKNQFDFINQFHGFEDCSFSHPNVLSYIGCQFALESNYGTSELARCFNNFSGMRVPRRRFGFYKTDDDGYPISHLGYKNGFAIYDSLQQCFLDYVVWLAWKCFTFVEMCDFEKFRAHLIEVNYCPEPDYFEKVDSIFRDFNSYHYVK